MMALGRAARTACRQVISRFIVYTRPRRCKGTTGRVAC